VVAGEERIPLVGEHVVHLPRRTPGQRLPRRQAGDGLGTPERDKGRTSSLSDGLQASVAGIRLVDPAP
jgi:hypothetical protein